MLRYVAVLLVLALPQMASAENVSFGASLDQDGGHFGGSATSVSGPASGRVHWSGNAITIEGGMIATHAVHLTGTITRSNDPNLEGKSVTIAAIPANGTLIFTIVELNQSYLGTGRVVVR